MSSPVTWNPVRQLWETEQADLFSGQQEPFLETWPTSGMTRFGRLLPLPMSAHRIGGNEFSSSPKLPTPQAKDGSGGCIEGTMGGKRPSGAHRTIPLATAIHHLPTPRVTDGTKGGPNQRGSSGDLMLPSVVMNLE